MDKIKRGDKVGEAFSGTMGIIADIQYEHDRYQFTHTSGWRYGIENIAKLSDNDTNLEPKVLIQTEVANAIEELQQGFAKRVIFKQKEKLDPRLANIDDWELAVVLLQGYEKADEIVMVLT